MKTKMTEDEKKEKYGPVVARFESASSPGTLYEVRQRKDGNYTCNCRGWATRKHCKHCEEVDAKQRWDLFYKNIK